MSVSIEVYNSSSAVTVTDSTASVTSIVPISGNTSFAGVSTGVLTGVTASILTYTVPTLSTFYLKHVSMSGTNMSTYWLDVDGTIIVRRRTNWTNLNDDFVIESDENSGLKIGAGSVITIFGKHNQAYTGDFDATIFGRLEG